MKLLSSLRIKLLQLFFTFLSVSQLTFSQTIPVQKIDSYFMADSSSLMIQDQIKDYDEYIVCTNYSAWTKEHISYFLGSKDGKWQAIRFFIDYKTDHYSTQKKFKIKKKKIWIKDSEISKMFDFFNSQGFWDLQKDSLFQHERKINDSLIQMIVVTDGNTDQIFISSKKQYFSISVYMADYYQNIYPNNQKSIFILSRNKFIALFEKKR